MSKRITDLNEALASRARTDDPPLELAGEPEPSRPRLADRIVALRPLTEQAVSIEPDPHSEPERLLTLADSRRFQPADSAATAPTYVPRNALVVYREAAAAARAVEEPRNALILDARAFAAFVIGLIIATVIGIALYSQLV